MRREHRGVDRQLARRCVLPLRVVDDLTGVQMDYTYVVSSRESQPAFLRPAAPHQRSLAVNAKADVPQDVLDQATVRHHPTPDGDLPPKPFQAIAHVLNL